MINDIVCLRFASEKQWMDIEEKFGIDGADIIGMLTHPQGVNEVASKGWHVNLMLPIGDFLPSELRPFVVKPTHHKREYFGRVEDQIRTYQMYDDGSDVDDLPETVEPLPPPTSEQFRAVRDAFMAAREVAIDEYEKMKAAVVERDQAVALIDAISTRRDAYTGKMAAISDRLDEIAAELPKVDKSSTDLIAALRDERTRLMAERDAERAWMNGSNDLLTAARAERDKATADALSQREALDASRATMFEKRGSLDEARAGIASK